MVLRNSVFWVLVILASAAVAGYFHFRPGIYGVPVIDRGEALVISGVGFGRKQNDGYVLFKKGDRPLDVLENVQSWSDHEIVVELPDEALAGGTVQVVKKTPLWEWPSNPVPYVIRARGLPTTPYGYDVPAREAAPWPTFRRDRRNTGRSPIPAVYQGDRPWSFKTGKGIFSTPVIDENGIAYVGSADHYFYALNPDGSLAWRFKTGELIDSAGALHRAEPGQPPAVTFGSGDGILYHVRTDGQFSRPEDRVLWTFNTADAPGPGYNNWFEGNVQIGFDGTIYAGNTNWCYYALYPDGVLKWKLATHNNNWSVAAIGDDGTIFWGSCDTRVYAVAPDGKVKWRKPTLGFVASSAALGRNGMAYIGSFDTHLYSFEPGSPWPKWKFKTDDHVYASPAIAEGADGCTTGIYVCSTDGRCYALDAEGRLRWKYDAGEPIRSSPVLGAGPDGTLDAIVYFGCGNGKVYALNTADGSRRWSFDTTPREPELRDRNDLNGSPALGKTGLYIGGEHGYVWYIPYDYCLHESEDTFFTPIAARCDCAPNEAWPDQGARLHYVTPGGNTSEAFPAALPASTIITLRLVVRDQGETRRARLLADTIQVRFAPEIACAVEPSAGADFLYIRPDGFFQPDTEYTLSISGEYTTGGIAVGNLAFGGRATGTVAESFTFRVPPLEAPVFPVPPAADSVSAVELTRLAVSVPTMLTSLNQIGFDYIEMILGAVTMTPADANGRGDCLLWAIGGRYDAAGRLVANAQQGVNTETDFTFPLNGRYQGRDFILEASDFTLGVTGIDIPFRRLEMRGAFDADGRVQPGAALYAETPVLAVPTYGPLIILAGMANNIWEKLLVVGTYVTRPYDPLGPANRKPAGIALDKLDFRRPEKGKSGYLIATMALEPDVTYLVSEHRAGLLLTDAATGRAVTLDYNLNLRSTHDGHGNLSTIALTIPPDTELPERLSAIVVLDVFPIETRDIAE